MNQKFGKAAERQAFVDLVKEGYTVIGSQVTVRTSIGDRFVDHLVRDANGNIFAIEVKSGNAVRGPSQLAKDNLISTEGGIVLGRNAPDGFQGRKIVVVTVEKRYSRESLEK